MKRLISAFLGKFRSKSKAQRIVKVHHRVRDRWLFLSVLVLAIFGLLMVYDASVAIAMRDFANPYYFVGEQLKWLIIGLTGMVVISRVDYRKYYLLSIPVLVATIGLLIAVFIPGLGLRAYGAHRWIHLGALVFQPSEFAKISMIIYFSAWLSHKEKGRFVGFLFLAAIIVGLILLEPDMGTASILLIISLLLYFFSGAPYRHFLYIIPILSLAVVGFILVAPYRAQRLTTFFNPQIDPLGSSYHVRQILIGLGSGGWTGVGIGKSRQKYEYLPEANTDSIFSVIGEEVGFIGASLVILLYLIIIWRGFRIAVSAPDAFGKLLACGVTCWIASQSGINLAAMVAIFPLTGIPLPFISYGGSSLILILWSTGILLGISAGRRSA